MNAYRYLVTCFILFASCEKKEAKPLTGCGGLDLSSQTPGPTFLKVKSILVTYCLQCHGGVNPQAGLDWSRDCDILTYWDRIKARAVDGDPSPMPQAGLMPLAERSKISAWIQAGHRYTD